MNKTLAQVIVLIVGLIILVPITNYVHKKLVDFRESNSNGVIVNNIVATTTPSTVENISYTVDGESFNLKNGKAENINQDSSSTNSLQIFGTPVYADLNADGVKDAALWLANNSGGTGTFYYAVLAINKDGKYESTNTLFLGDRIAPQTLEIQDGRAVFNFADRRQDEPMSADPSIGKSLWINYDKNTGQIGEWVKGFEGEADPEVMKLDMKTWNWVSTVNNKGVQYIPKSPNRFTLTFKTDKTFSATTDCNNIGGEYIIDGLNIKFDKVFSTKMYCDGSQETDFSTGLNDVEKYHFTSKGELIFEDKIGSGRMTFN